MGNIVTQDIRDGIRRCGEVGGVVGAEMIPLNAAAWLLRAV